MRGCLGWLFLLPIVFAFWLTVTIGNACARRETGAWRTLGVLSSLVIGGFCAFIGWLFGPGEGLIIGWIALVGGGLMALAGIWTSLVATRQSIEAREELERQERQRENQVRSWTLSEAKRMLEQDNIDDYEAYEITKNNLLKMREFNLSYDLEKLAKKQMRQAKQQEG